MRKKIIYIILTTILLTITSSVYGFTDIENHWASDSIIEFNKANIIKGYENDEFKPDGYITRAEVATIINRMNGATKESQKYIPDINRNDWYYSEIRKSVQMGVMQGDENGYTNPNSYVTREEAIVMLGRAFYVEDSVVSKSDFADEDEISAWAEKTLNTFAKFKYISGYEDNKVKPKSNITRAELITIIDRMFAKIATIGVYEGNISGNMIVVGKNVVLNNITINGNLIITEGTNKTLKLNNVEVKGNLILREEIEEKEILCSGRKIALYIENDEKSNQYKNTEYGIEFSISSEVKVIEKWNSKEIDYQKDNIIIIDIEKNDEYYLKGINTLSKNQIKKVDNIYHKTEEGKINNAQYELFTEVYKNGKNALLFIKRDNVLYTIRFNNIQEKNLIDNVIGTLNLFETKTVNDRKNVIYKNNKLNLKFSYKEGYIGVDDSYNTGNIYSGDAPLKLFIQVNSITDIDKYSFEEVVYLLKTLAKEEGELLETEVLENLSYKAVLFKITSEGKTKYSLYMLNERILYNFILISNEEIVNEIGKDLFNEVIKSIEI